ncbi:energy-coupling factor ABC transporter permease [Methanococcus maripaludis]|uniref:Putative cobalt transport protein CbiM n=1 Tax=Methanococcus maripaludis TaxID=39152 RepID=A0A7J9RYD7_METMI|nr:energy-coupling factor ABC transporter permease [Methanococcus maripaludis]MBA2847380.1 cobalt/nickel transport system permease protein [Methanococcus maripaludis]MBB6067231.1 cobalt/nickel transport system permease protein [Methanococcus maripaludis]MBM7409521.1 cobalt/nickel transport system permease protein [Methanococcus maripaludis]MBP2219727.1 cobalt/nickel transport system permease protein [Methanococcus maripaludis]
MHIMEGFLPPMWAAFWFVLSGIVVIYGIIQLNKLINDKPEVKPTLALAGAFMFILSSLKLPSVTGSCSHPTGGGLGAIMFGPAITAVLATIVLLFQAILLAHGGLTTLGANIFSMGIMGPAIGFLVFKLLKGKLNITWVVVLAAIFADWGTYATTSIQLALAYPLPDFGTALANFGTVFAVTQIPLAIMEGLLTGLIWDYIMKLRPDLLAKLGLIDLEKAKGGAE